MIQPSAMAAIVAATLGHIRAHAFLYGRLLLVFSLVWVNLQVQENFPFSHFPMFGNPNPNPVDYYFLTDSQGRPLASREMTHHTTPAIKKIMARGLREQRERRSSSGRSGGTSQVDVNQVAQAALLKMHSDAIRHHPTLAGWPAGVQLQQGLIETTPRGFRETFRTVASLPQAAQVTGGTPVVGGAHAKSAPDTEPASSIWMVVLNGGGVLVMLAAMLAGVRFFPGKLRCWLSAGIGSIDEVGRLEAFFLRAGLAALLWQALQSRVEVDSLPYPQGLALLEGWQPLLIWLGQPDNWELVQSAAAPLLLWYVCGWGQLIPLTLLTLVHILQRTLFASQGATHHGHQLLSLVFCAQTIFAWGSFLGRAAGGRCSRRRSGSHTVIWQGVGIVVAAVYVTSAVQKLIESDGRWLLNSHHLSSQIVKTHRQSYYDDLDPRYLEGPPLVSTAAKDPNHDRYRHPIPYQAQWVLSHPHLARVFFAAGFFVELSAFFIVLHRGFATMLGLALISFHFLVLWLMGLTFPLNVGTLWVVAVNLPAWLIWCSYRSTSWFGVPVTSASTLPRSSDRR